MLRPPSLIPVLLLLLVLLGGCATNPVSGEQDLVFMSEEEEIELGAEVHEEILKQYRVYEDEALQRYVDDLGQQLARKSHRDSLTFTFTVLDSPQVNAFALPGGYIYITRGIMAYLNSEAELAGVIGHEIGHVTARHSVQQQRNSVLADAAAIFTAAILGVNAANAVGVAGQAAVSGYGRDDELEADRLGAEYLARVGYEPEEMIKVVGVLKDQELYEKALAEKEGREARTYHGVFATHPENDRRLQEVVRAAASLEQGTRRGANQASYFEQIDGLVFGTSEKDGVVRGNQFFHTDLGIAFDVPEGWRIDNLPDRLMLMPADGTALAQITVTSTEKEEVREALLEHLNSDNLNYAQELEKSDFPTYTGFKEVRTPFGARQARFVGWLAGERLFVFAGVARDTDKAGEVDTTFRKITQSFRKLSEAERELARPLRLKIETAPAGGYAELAEGSPLEDAAAQLRLINGDYPDAEREPGAQIKAVR